VNLFKEDGTVIHFVNPKVQASIAANTYVVSGHADNKKLQDLLPNIINQLGPDNLEHLKKVYASFAGKAGATGAAAVGGPSAVAGGGATGAAPTGKPDDKKAGGEDDDVPELVESFEAVSNKAGGKPDDKKTAAPAAVTAASPKKDDTKK